MCIQSVQVLLGLHGCGHGAADWALQSERCPDCIGLPEELAVVKRALAAGFAVVAIDSIDRATKCWHPQHDGPMIAEVVEVLREDKARRWADLPVFAFGASSGGSMAAALPYFVELAAVAVQVLLIASNAVLLVISRHSLAFVARALSTSACGLSCISDRGSLTLHVAPK